MIALLTFLWHLVLYPVLALGLVTMAATIYNWLLDRPDLGMHHPSRARKVIAVIAVIFVCVLAFGTPNFGLAGIVVVLFWASAFVTGVYKICKHRQAIKDTLKSMFGCGC